MLEDKLKEKIHRYILNDLTPGEEQEVLQLLQESEEIQNYIKLSRLTWDALDDIPSIEPESNYMGKFWEKVEEENSKKFNIFEYLNLNWAFVGSFAVFCLVSVFIINIYISNRGYDLSDEELITQLEDSIAVNSSSSLDVFGPWEE